MPDIAFDIETEDLPREIQERRCKPFIDEPFVDASFKPFSPGNAKKPETVAAKRAQWEAEKEQWESSVEERRAIHEQTQGDRRQNHYDEKLSKARLKAHQSQIICFSTYGVEGGECVWADGNEERLVRKLVELLDQTLSEGHLLVGANVHGFDVPYIYRRALIHGIPMTQLVTLRGRYSIHQNVIDVLKVYQGPEWGQIPPLGLDVLADCFGVEGKTETAGGAKFAELAREDRERAERYAIADSRVAFEIAQRMGIVAPF